VPMLPLRRNLLLTIVLAWATGIVARLGAALSIVPGPVAAGWLCAGLALAALMVFGRRAVAGLALGLFAGNLFAGGPIEMGDAPAAALVALGELAQAGLAAALLRTFPHELPRNPVRQTLRFALVITLCGLVAATVGTFG